MKNIILLFLLLSVVPAFCAVPVSNHVVVVVEENHDYSQVIGSSSMPYLNGLASQYGLATQYFANTHPSIGNYFMLTAGAIITNDDGFNGTVSNDNIVRHLIQAGKTWKSYAESIPSVGYIGGDTGSYMQHHNPFTYFTDVVNSSSEKQNLVPFTQFAKDLAANQLPNFSFVVPNTQNDAHDGSLQQADNWLKTNIAPLLSNSAFQQDGLLIIVFDEGSSDNTNGGGKVAWIAVGPNVIKGHKSTTSYQHQSTLRLVLESLGVNSLPGAAASAPSMNEFFQAATPQPSGDFSLNVSPGAQTVTRGQSVSYTVTVTPSNGFANAVTLSCPNLPAGLTCAFDKTSITPNGSAANAKLTVQTSTSAALHRHGSGFSALAFWLPGLGLGMVVASRPRGKARWIALAAVLAILAFVLVGCGGAASTSSNTPPPTGGSGNTPGSGQPPSTFSVQVAAVSGSLQHTTNASVTLQ